MQLEKCINKHCAIILNCMRFVPAVTNTDSTDTWQVWSRGAQVSQGSQVPFHECMQCVSSVMSDLNDDSGTLIDQYKRAQHCAVRLRHLLTDVFPRWRHRLQCTQVLPDAREPYVYGLYCYARGHAYGLVVDHTRESGTKLSLSGAACNAAHLKMVAAQLMCDMDICQEAHAHASDMMSLYAAHLRDEYSSSDAAQGMGGACACQLAAVHHLEHAGLDASRARELHASYVAQNTVGLCEVEVLPSVLPHVELTPLPSDS